MKKYIQAQSQQNISPTLTPVRSRVLQRRSMKQNDSFIEPLTAHATSHFGHDFSRVPAHTVPTASQEEEKVLRATEVFGHTPQVAPALESQVNGLRVGQDFGRVRSHHDDGRVQRRRNGRFVTTTNYAFDTFNLTESHLSDPDIIARLEALTQEQLVEYRNRVADPAVQVYIDGLIAPRPVVPCTSTEVADTTSLAETARTASLPWVQLARRALDRLHNRWAFHKRDIIGSRRALAGVPVCAFNSNFNINARDPDYGVRHISVASRLRQLERWMGSPVAYTCQPSGDPQCSGRNQDTVAYVRGGRPPIHFCSQFRTDPDQLSRQGTVIHEFAHLLPGVDDSGGYALGGFGAQVMTCSTGYKFSAASDVLTHTADAVTGFVMNIGLEGSTNVLMR